MTLTALWWVLLVGTLATLIYNVVAIRRGTTRGEPVTGYFASNMPGALGMLCLVSANLVGLTRQLARVLLGVSCVFLMADVLISMRARRRVLAAAER